MNKNKKKNVRYAVVGLGSISQEAVLPAFKHATRNSGLAALVSGDAAKLRRLGRKYGVKALCPYERYDDLLKSGEIDAVYIALPNHLHSDYAVRACTAGIHVLCEKPMEVTEARCGEMIRAAEEAHVKLMIAYRLHFEEANLRAIELIRKGRIGEARLFSSAFTVPVDPRNYRAGPREKGGGPTYDIGLYCLNAARYLFRSEPVEVSAMAFGTNRDGRGGSEQSMAVVLRFEQGQAASFVCGFGAFPAGDLQVIGTQGTLTIQNAYDYTGAKKVIARTQQGKTLTCKAGPRDQFAAEILYFSDCILRNRQPEPSGSQGLADVRVIEAIFDSADSGRTIRLMPLENPVLVDTRRADRKQAA